MTLLKRTLKKFPLLIFLYQWRVASNHFLKFKLVRFFLSSIDFWKDYYRYNKLSQNTNFKTSYLDAYPCLTDKVASTPIEPIYYYQDSWGAKKIFELNPNSHIDVGSSAKLVSILAQKIPTSMVDIRPIEYPLEGLSFIKGSILDLPFKNDTLDTISSLCVVEHIGLGRYGDPLDQWGSEKAINELIRVVKPGGHIIFSVPVGPVNKVQFNAQRIFTKGYIVDKFASCHLVENKYIYGKNLVQEYNPSAEFGVGLFLFKKNNSN